MPLPHPSPAPPAPPGASHALALLSVETLPWGKDWAAWRIRFACDSEQRGAGPRDIAAMLPEVVAPLCRGRVACAETVLYLAEAEDVKRVFFAFGAVAQGRGAIAAIQAQASYRHAVEMAAELVTGAAASGAEAEAAALPDMSWDVAGFGQARVATAQVRGHVVVVRLGMVNNQEMWVLDVNGHPGCARFRLRQDAMSKMGVTAALRSYDLRRAGRPSPRDTLSDRR